MWRTQPQIPISSRLNFRVDLRQRLLHANSIILNHMRILWLFLSRFLLRSQGERWRLMLTLATSRTRLAQLFITPKLIHKNLWLHKITLWPHNLKELSLKLKTNMKIICRPKKTQDLENMSPLLFNRKISILKAIIRTLLVESLIAMAKK